MIPTIPIMNGSVQHRLEWLYDFWFSHRDIWFDATDEDDVYVVEMFAELIPELLELKAMDTISSKKIWIGAILALDQVSRHIQRVDPSRCCVHVCTERALQISQHLLQECPSYHIFTCEEICFILLPMRHVKKVSESIDVLVNYINQHCNRTPPPIAKRFLRASYKSLMLARNEQVLANGTKKDTIIPVNFTELKIPKAWTALIHTTLQRMEIPSREVLVSLSGGVDSVVLMVCLLSMGYRVHALHINYCNRVPRCDEEEAFVQDLCASWGVPLTVRRFTEFTKRTEYVDREAYEEITKFIRFDMYKKLSRYQPHTFLGHHKDDCMENIITNLTKGKRLDNLRGMTEVERVSGVTVLRPFVTVHKEDIVGFATKHCIPHLVDNTSPECTRGKIRTKLLPAFDEYNLSFRNSLVSLDRTLSDLYGVLNHYCDQILESKDKGVTKTKAGLPYIQVTFDAHTYNIPLGFSAIAWRVLCNKWGVYNVTHRCLDNLVAKIATSDRVQKHALNKHHMIYIKK
jgi:tRNA(Ile)-lysidine synthetase-like protein